MGLWNDDTHDIKIKTIISIIILINFNNNNNFNNKNSNNIFNTNNNFNNSSSNKHNGWEESGVWDWSVCHEYYNSELSPPGFANGANSNCGEDCNQMTSKSGSNKKLLTKSEAELIRKCNSSYNRSNQALVNNWFHDTFLTSDNGEDRL